MSGSAGLSAARRRRGVLTPETKVNPLSHSSYRTGIQEEIQSKPVPPGVLLIDHDKKLFNLQQKMSYIEENFLVDGFLENIQKSSVNADKYNQMAQKMVEQKLENSQNKQIMHDTSKHMREMNSLLVTLRASLLRQTEELNNMKLEVNTLSKQVITLEDKISVNALPVKVAEIEEEIVPPVVASVDVVDSADVVDSTDVVASADVVDSTDVVDSADVVDGADVVDSADADAATDVKVNKKGRNKKSKGIFKLDVDSSNKDI